MDLETKNQCVYTMCFKKMLFTNFLNLTIL